MLLLFTTLYHIAVVVLERSFSPYHIYIIYPSDTRSGTESLGRLRGAPLGRIQQQPPCAALRADGAGLPFSRAAPTAHGLLSAHGPGSDPPSQALTQRCGPLRVRERRHRVRRVSPDWRQPGAATQLELRPDWHSRSCSHTWAPRCSCSALP